MAQISANLLRDEELVNLIAAAGGKWIFIGMESIDPPVINSSALNEEKLETCSVGSLAERIR